MYLLTKASFKRNDFLNFLIALFPLSFIAGNMIININLVLVIISSIFLFKKDLFKIELFFLDKMIFSFFLVVILTGIINDYYFYTKEMAWRGYFTTFITSIFFLKYLFLYIVLRFLVEKEIVNLKLFFIFSCVATLFVSLDIVFQFLNGKDIFGFEGRGRKLSGPFGDELIAGGFIQRFFLFSFFVIPLFFKNSNVYKYNKYLIFVIFLIFFLGIVLSGNRMPFMIFTIMIFFLLIVEKQTRKFLLPFLIFFFISFYTLFKSNIVVKNNFLNFFDQIYRTTNLVINKDFFNKNSPQYLKEFSTFYETWLMNKYIGGGIKNFRYYCHERPNIDRNVKFVCNMHPHNYYLEILTETGILGFIIISFVFFNILFLSFKKKYSLIPGSYDVKILIPFVFLFIGEIFPIKSTGSFFTTGNTTYLFLIIGLLIGLIRRNNLIENKNLKI
tara:strand:+ start:806 stop:2134 length:1329 start_codon:yes stop_codon:yes gene_type:complete